jgi:hypothetical protein
VIGTDCLGSCKSNYHVITAMTAPIDNWMCTGVPKGLVIGCALKYPMDILYN